MALLAKLGEKYDCTTEGLPLLAPGGITVSSTSIRQVLAAGEVTEAAGMLGRSHRVDGVVVRGNLRGRLPPHTAIPADGVYAGWLAVFDESGAEASRWPAVISIGTSSAFDRHVRPVKASVLDRADLDLYGLHAGIDFAVRRRGMLRFESVDALVEQMRTDVERTREICAD